MSKTPERSSLGTFLPEFKEPLVHVTARIPKSLADELKQVENKSEFFRVALAEALKKRKTKTSVPDYCGINGSEVEERGNGK